MGLLGKPTILGNPHIVGDTWLYSHCFAAMLGHREYEITPGSSILSLCDQEFHVLFGCS